LAAEIKIDQFHNKLVREAFQKALSDSDAMLLFCLLHTCEIEVEAGVLNPSTRTVAAAITQRHAGEVVASLYGRKKSDDYRANPSHWYWLWNGDWGGYAHAEHLADEEGKRIHELKDQLRSHPWVYDVREED
jgi:hypothetical protein